MILGMMVLCPWYPVDPVKGIIFMFESMVNGLAFMNSSTCIYMCCNIERNIMKN